MAALRVLCFSPPTTAPLLYATLCARHRLLLTAVSNQRSAFLNFLGSNKGRELSSIAGDGPNDLFNVPEKDENPTFEEYQDIKPVTIEYTSSASELNEPPPPDYFTTKQRFMDFVNWAEDDEEARVVIPDVVKPRGSYLRQESKDLLFERLPAPKKSDLKFTIGRRITTLKKAKSAVAKKKPLSEDLQIDNNNLISVGKRSRTAGQSESTREVIDYVANQSDMYKQDQALYNTALPSVLGANAFEISESCHKLTEAGFSSEEVSRILPIFPHIFEVEFSALYEVYSLLKKYILSQTRVFKLLRNQPLLLTIEPSKVSLSLQCLLNADKPQPLSVLSKIYSWL